ncbi:hypothetical protein RchiOBHm_Chr6g0302871 [Rosa chinensis]|uniref:Uncharacterized protein n=1 Tax=Rosa chinensis TaxID=74649 RepID=A0A2P6PZ42_ROSCH|nr:uncharacterized protein LOC112173745 [Rosa chinensis]PRQ27208.1 hypothetical protein RchiOBHm_Chr6g0302871 [Rosa chinensis]
MESAVIERKGSGKLGWREQTLASMSVPPSPLIALVGIVVLLLYLSSYSNYRAQMYKTQASFNLFLLFLPMILIFLAYYMTKYGRFMSPSTKEKVVNAQSGASPWGVSLFLGLMLMLVSYQSYFQSKWWPHWRAI